LREDGVIEYGFVPLQAADWLAWEMNRAARNFYPEKLELESQMRWPMQQFWRHPPGRLGLYAPENLKAMDKMIELENTVDSWEARLGLGKHANLKGKAAQ